MTALPRSLLPWEPELRVFARDVAIVLGELVPRIAASLGPARGSSPMAVGEPDGYAGLSNRGPMTRLLASEWLLAQEIPDEFVRRAAAGEQAFLALAHREERGDRAITALFDAGPSQLGAPRIGQLALLVVLAQRARFASAVLRWAVLQGTREPLVGIDPNGVRAFLAGRTGREPTEGDVSRWRAKLGAGEEEWLVGGHSLAALGRGAEVALLEDGADLEAPSIVLRRQGPRRSVSLLLDLPDRRMTARLLRDPLGDPVDVRRRPEAFGGGRLLFSSDGRRLLVRTRTGQLFAVPVPNSAKAATGHAACFRPPPGQTVVAADWRGGSWHVVTQADRMLRVWLLGKRGGRSAQPRSVFSSDVALRAPTEGAPLAQAVVMPESRITFAHPCGPLDIVHTLFRPSAFVAATVCQRTFLAVGQRPDGERMLLSGDIGSTRELTCQMVLPPTADALRTGFAPRDARPGLGAVAVRTAPGAWAILGKSGVTHVAEPPGFVCIGVVDGGALVGFLPGQRELIAVGATAQKQVALASSPIDDACVSPTQPYVAYVTVGGELIVRDVVAGNVLMQLLGPSE